MFPSHGKSPPLSPVLLAGIITRPLSPRLLQPILDGVFALLKRKHPDLFERLSCLPAPVFLIDPVDLPLVFLLDANPKSSRLSVSRKSDGRAGSVIRGPLITLMDLLEGRMDGDALFFSRGLSIEGDTEAVVALRNAVDDAGINLRDDLLASLGPLAFPARHALNLGGFLYTRIDQDLKALRSPVQMSSSKAPEA